MDYADYLIVKGLVLLFLAFGWGVYCGITGRSMTPGPRERQDGPYRQ